MTIAEQIKRTKEALQAWAQTSSGVVYVATDPVDYFSVLRTGPGKLRAVILFFSEDKRGEYEESGVVDRKFWIGLGRGRGLQLNRADAMISDSGAGPAMFNILEQVRDVVRAINFDSPSTEATADYRGFKPFEVDGWILDAFTLEFWLGTQLPAAAPKDEAPES